MRGQKWEVGGKEKSKERRKGEEKQIARRDEKTSELGMTN